MKFKQHCKIVRSKVKIFEKIRLPFTVKAICLALLKLAVRLKSNETVACFKKFLSINTREKKRMFEDICSQISGLTFACG